MARQRTVRYTGDVLPPVNGQLNEGLAALGLTTPPPAVYPIKPEDVPAVQPAVDNSAALLAEIARLKAENEGLKNRPVGKLTLKRSEKGAVSVYGMGKWPVTLYREQWERLLAAGDEIKQFIADNDSVLKRKGDD